MITTITGKNQITVPAAIVAKENMRPGMRLDWQLTDEKHTLLVRVLPDRRTLASELRGSGRKYQKSGASAVQSLIDERGREDRERC